MDHDDRPVGTLLERREVLALLGASGLALLGGALPRAAAQDGADAADAADALPACVVVPEQSEGPYFVDDRLRRADVRSDTASGEMRPGAPLELTLRVLEIGAAACAPLAGAVVDIWQCDAQGVYSGVRDLAGRFDTRERDFLRGWQRTDAAGEARFTSIYPGWYPGRTVHIHLKVRVGERPVHEFTSQLYFDDALSDAVLGRPPYASAGGRRTRNAGDGLFRRGGERLVLDVEPRGEGYAATFEIGMVLG